jgi:glycosyltransferase involved in cell wall biosynthesis
MAPLHISFFEASPHGEALLDPEYPEHTPVGGSETATVRLAQTLRTLGHVVTLLTRREQLVGHVCDVFVSCRVWEIFHAGHLPGAVNYLWCQDDANALAHTPLARSEIAAAVFGQLDGVALLSHYQTGRWLETFRLPVEKIFAISNGVPRARFQFDASPASLAARPRAAYYASTPFRGLHLLARAWPLVRGVVRDAELHVFSSMQVYRADEPPDFRQLYATLRTMAGVHYHGSVGQKTLRERSTRCRVLAYPCVFPETSCIAAMEAMAAGCVVSGTVVGALPETAWRNPMTPIADGWLERWAFETVRLLVDDDYYMTLARQNLATVQVFDWPDVAHRWLQRWRLDHGRAQRRGVTARAA